MHPTRAADQEISALFSVSRPFSPHLTKREDPQLPDKYDHNSFFYTGQPSAEEIRRALAYQKDRGDTFLKLEGYTPLNPAFGLEEDSTLTMVLPPDADLTGWKTHPQAVLRAPDPAQLEQHERKYYGPLYGEDFTVRNNRRLRQKLDYLGAYLEGRLVGSCYYHPARGYLCMDSLVVDEDYRHRYLATTLIRQLARQARDQGLQLYLHADPEDTPRQLYARLGFVVVDRGYEYLCTDFSALRLD